MLPSCAFGTRVCTAEIGGWSHGGEPPLTNHKSVSAVNHDNSPHFYITKLGKCALEQTLVWVRNRLWDIYSFSFGACSIHQHRGGRVYDLCYSQPPDGHREALASLSGSCHVVHLHHCRYFDVSLQGKGITDITKALFLLREPAPWQSDSHPTTLRVKKLL